MRRVKPDTASAGTNKFFRKIEQVSKLGDVLKFPSPKYTEVNASTAAGIFDPKPSRSVEFGQKVIS
jgi:hypothetical protein